VAASTWCAGFRGGCEKHCVCALGDEYIEFPDANEEGEEVLEGTFEAKEMDIGEGKLERQVRFGYTSKSPNMS
jgi:hypothetical protein